MARVINAATQAALEAGRIARDDLLLFDFPAPTGIKAFFSGQGELVHNGVTYVGAGSLFEIAPVGSVMDGTAQGIVIKVNAEAREGLDPTILSSFETINYVGRPAILAKCYRDPDSYAVLSVETEWRGYVDYAEYEVTEGGGAALSVPCESRSLDLGRSGYRMRTDADQRLIDPNDGFLKGAPTAGQKQLAFGRVTPETFGAGKKKSGFKLF